MLLAVATGCITGFWMVRAQTKSMVLVGNGEYALRGQPWIAPYAILALGIAAAAISSQSDASLASPWQVLSHWNILLFGGAVGVGLWIVSRTSRNVAWIMSILQGILAYGVSLIIYRFGFGFDPFIHQAAVRSLVEHSSIRLTSPLYVGYYTLIALLHTCTRLSVSLLDRVLVPFSMTIAFACWTVIGTRWWQLPRWSGWLLLILPYSFATFSVPYHLSVVLMLLVTMILPRLHERPWFVTALLVTCFSTLVHPLVTVPLGMMIFAERTSRPGKEWCRILTLVLATAVGIVGLFHVYVISGGGSMGWPTISGLRSAFHTLTGFPYTHEVFPWWLALVIRASHVWMIASVLVGAVGWIGLAPKTERARGRRMTAIAFGTAIAALFVAASFSFQNIAPMEQYEFALRLRNLLPWFVFPGIAYAALWLSQRSWAGNIIVKGIAVAVVALGASMVWFTAYPPYAPGMRMIAPGLGMAEFVAFDAAELLADKAPYVALAPQMVSAAALARIGFDRELQTADGERYPYAIPTGGELYQWYLELWTERDPFEMLEQVCIFSRVSQVVIIVPVAWDPTDWIHARLVKNTEYGRTEDAVHRLYRYSCAQ